MAIVIIALVVFIVTFVVGLIVFDEDTSLLRITVSGSYYDDYGYEASIFVSTDGLNLKLFDSHIIEFGLEKGATKEYSLGTYTVDLFIDGEFVDTKLASVTSDGSETLITFP